MQSSTLVLAATLAIQSLVAMCLMTLPVVAPSVAQSLGMSTAYLGVFIALAYVGAMTGSLTAGALVKRFGAIRASQAGLVLCASGVALCAVPSPVAIALGALLLGLGYGPITPASSHLLARSTPAHRMSFVFSIKQTGVPLGGVLAGAIVPGLADLTGWQAAFLVVAAANLLCAVVVEPLRRTLDSDRDRAQRLSLGSGLAGPVRMVFSQRSLAVLAGISFLFAISQVSLTTYMVTFLHEDLGMDLVAGGFVLAVAQGAGVGGRLLWGYVSDHFLGPIGTLALLSAGIALCALATPFLHYMDSSLVILIVLSVFGGCAIGWNGVYLAEVARQAPVGQAGLATGGTLAMTFVGVVVGPPLFGVIATTSGSYGLAYAALVLPAVGCMGLLWVFRSAFIRS